MCGVNSGLCLPRRRSAISLAKRPSVLSVASTTNHSWFTSPLFALYVFMIDRPCRAKFKEREYYSIDRSFSSVIFTYLLLDLDQSRLVFHATNAGRGGGRCGISRGHELGGFRACAARLDIPQTASLVGANRCAQTQIRGEFLYTAQAN